MFAAFSTALSAISAHSTAVDVIGNNLANLNTPGYKTNVVSFRDLVTQSIGAGLGDTQVGFGTGRPFTIRQFSQGAIQPSSGLLDAAVQGDGFFILRNALGATLLTRAGNFLVDTSGYLVALSGERVQGWVQGPTGQVDTHGAIGEILIPVGTLKTPIATTRFSLDINLNAGAQAGQPDGTFSTPIEIIDSLGNSHVLTVAFAKEATANQWSYSITIPGADVGDPNPSVEVAQGNISFDADGKLSDPPDTSPTVSFNIAGLVSGARDFALEWEIYTPTLAPHLSQYRQTSAVSANEQNGAAAASLIRVAIGDGGRVLAQYTNGQQTLVANLAIASIRNPDSLIAMGNNCFQASARTALPAIGLPESGGRGKVVGGALENSTVDIAKEFTNLIVFQRGYQANARVVIAVDELSQETINLKR